MVREDKEILMRVFKFKNYKRNLYYSLNNQTIIKGFNVGFL